MAAVTICSDFGAKKIKSVTVSTVSPSMCHEVMGPDAMILVFLMLSFKPAFSLSYFTFIKRLFSSSSLSWSGRSLLECSGVFGMFLPIVSSPRQPLCLLPLVAVPCQSQRRSIRVVSSAYLRLLIFLLAILIPACASPRPAFCMMYSAYKLNKLCDNIQ